MCETTSATAEAIYTVLNEKIFQLEDACEPWHNSTSAGIVITSANIDIRNSLKTSIIAHNDSIYFSGCPCHIIHNDFQKT